MATATELKAWHETFETYENLITRDLCIGHTLELYRWAHRELPECSSFTDLEDAGRRCADRARHGAYQGDRGRERLEGDAAELCHWIRCVLDEAAELEDAEGY